MIKVNKRLNILNYVMLVESLVDGYFDDDDRYIPHYGRINEVRLFYNYCVEGSYLDLPEIITEFEDVDVLLKDEEFLKAYDEYDEMNFVGTTFTEARIDANQIVAEKLKSHNRVISFIEKIVNKLMDRLEDTMSDETLDKLKSIADGVAKGDIDADAIVKAYKENMLSGAE